MKILKLREWVLVGAFLVVGINTLLSCATPQHVIDKSGAELWAQNCNRCHNTASPATFSDVQWDVALTHMQIRAQIPEAEAKKIYEFIISAN